MGPEATTPPARLARLGALSLVEANGDALTQVDGNSSPAQSPPALRLEGPTGGRTHQRRRLGATRPPAESAGGASTARTESSRMARQRGATLRQYAQGRDHQFDQAAEHEVKLPALALRLRKELSCERPPAYPSTPGSWQTPREDWTSWECP